MFESFRQQNRSALVPFIMAGDPSIEVSEQIASALIEEGAGVLEIGLPFSDAMADGPVIQLAAERALKNNVGLEDVFAMTSRLKRRYPHIELVLFTYLNPLEKYGLENYVKKAKASGFDATLTVDLPPEEAAAYLRLHEEQGLKTIFLVSPTTSRERLSVIAKASTGFIYVVSRLGVTGTHASFSHNLEENVARVRKATSLPVAVGFGISTQQHAAEVARLADGVVVGSAFVKLIAEIADPQRLENEVRCLARVLTNGIQSK